MRKLLALGALALFTSGCYALRPARGGGMTRFSGERRFNVSDIALPRGYVIEKVASGLTFPTGVVFDDRDRIYVVEAGYARGDAWANPRLLRLEPNDRHTVVAEGGKNGPWTGAVFRNGLFYVAEGGALEGGRILQIQPDASPQGARITTLLENLPTYGDHSTGGPALGPDGLLYVGLGTFTNSGVVGEDNVRLGWADRFPDAHDVPCGDVVLAGRNFKTRRGDTGAFVIPGRKTEPGQVIKGEFPCTGAILRLPLDPGRPAQPELVAWGFRNPHGLAFSPDGRLFASDSGYEERGVRPVWGAGDLLWSVSTGAWHGWPDFAGDRALEVEPLLAKHPNKPPKPAAVLGVHAFSHGLDFSRSPLFGHVGEAFIAQFGDLTPFSGKTLQPVGFRIVRVDPATGVIEDFAVNRGERNGPASKLGTGGLERPLAVRFDPAGRALYIVDFGVMTSTKKGPEPVKGTGAVWRVTRRS